MNRRWNFWMGVGACATLFLVAAANAQAPAQQQQTAPAQGGKAAEATPPPPSAEETAAYKTFDAVPASDAQKKIDAGEAFLQKYPQSRFRQGVYQTLVSEYYTKGQVPQLLAAGDKDIELNPNDAPVLAIVGFTMARSYNANSPDAVKDLAKAEEYTKKAIEIVPGLPKPDKMSDADYQNAKNDTLSTAHSGLGLVYVRQGKFAEAIPELETSIKLDTHPDPDPVNYYLLGLANQRSSHFDDAVKAFNKCASLSGSLQGTCKNGAQSAKTQGESQLSAPK